MPNNLENLRIEFENTEISKRIYALELFAQNHGFSEWKGSTLQDWWLSKYQALLQQKIERVRKEQSEWDDMSEYTQGIRTGFDEAIKILEE